MINRRFNIVIFVILVYVLISASIAGSQLTASIDASKTLVTINGVRISQTAWGLGPDNYMAGVTSKQRLPSSGQLEFWIAGTGPDSAIGSGTGYKALVQFWNDVQNYIALGLIHDPGPSPDGITVMVEGAADSLPVGGYWGSDMPPITNDRHHIVVSWTPTQISWVIDDYESHRMTFNINMNNPSFSILGAARLPGDSVSVNFESINLIFNQDYNVEYVVKTWDNAEGEVKLQWDANPEPDLAGYRIYYGNSSRIYSVSKSVGIVTNYTVTGLTIGETYYFAATAVNISGGESEYSNEVSTTIASTDKN